MTGVADPSPEKAPQERTLESLRRSRRFINGIRYYIARALFRVDKSLVLNSV